jgi:hypothetical protein
MLQVRYLIENIDSCYFIATSTSGFPSLSNPEIVGIGFDAFRLFASVASGCGVVVARKWTELDSCC